MTSASAWYADRRVAVIGGLGFIGARLTRALLAGGASVTVVTPSAAAHAATIGRLPRPATIVEGVLQDADVMRRVVEGQAVVFNMAGRSGAVRSMEDPWTDLEVNCRGNLVLLEALRAGNPSAKVVFPGSRLEYGRPATIPAAEDHPMAPLSVHGAHKLAVEHYYGLYQKIYGLRTTVLRITNPYGPGQPAARVAYGVVNRFIHLALADQTLPIYGDGAQVRDYVFVEDVVDALLRAGATTASDGRVYNVGSGKGVRLVDMARLIVEIAGKGRLAFVPWDALAERIETGDFVADVSRIARELDWRPQVALEDGIARTVAAERAR